MDPFNVAVYIGTSGSSYNHWAGIVYPRGASSLERLDAYVARFATVEVNNTFYRWPKETVFATWRAYAGRLRVLPQGVARADAVPQAE
jgi:uncharacterized protein YecE (DUF72 family)